jgi:dihydropyrimidinase
MIAAGVTSFKLYMAYKGNLQVDDGVIYKALEKCKEVNGLIGFHCENGDLIDVLVKEAKQKGNKRPVYHALCRPAEVEKEAMVRVLNIAEILKAPVYIVHLSTKEGLLAVLDAKKRGIEVYVETCPQYLLLNDSYYGDTDGKSLVGFKNGNGNGNDNESENENENNLEGSQSTDCFEGAKYVMSPPLRKKSDQEALWNGLASGEIQTIGTDHCSFNYKGQKELGIDDFSKIPNGAPGVEHRMELLYTYGVCKGKLTMNQMVELTSTNAAKLFGIFPEKGTIAVGSDADLIIWDPAYKSVIDAKEQTQRVDYTPYQGFEQLGRPFHVLLRGKVLVRNGKLEADKTEGKYLHRKTYSDR